MTDQKRTPKEIAVSIIEETFNEYDTRDIRDAIEQAIKAERGALTQVSETDKEKILYEPCPHGVKYFTWCKECAKIHCRHWSKKGECRICDLQRERIEAGMKRIIYQKLVAFTFGETANLHEVLTLAVDGNLSAKTMKAAVKEMRISLSDQTLKPKVIYRVTVERIK